MPDLGALALQLRAFIRILFVMTDCEPKSRAAAQRLVPHPPIRKD